MGFFSNTAFAADLSLTSATFGRSDNMTSIQVIIQNDGAGKYNLSIVRNSNPTGVSTKPIGPLANGMTCSVNGDLTVSPQSINCIKDDAHLDGRIDIATIRQNDDGTYQIDYSWQNVKDASNKGTKSIASSLNLLSISIGDKTINFAPSK